MIVVSCIVFLSSNLSYCLFHSGVGEHCDGRSDVLPQGRSISQDYCTSQQEEASLDQSNENI